MRSFSSSLITRCASLLKSGKIVGAVTVPEMSNGIDAPMNPSRVSQFGMSILPVSVASRS